MSRIGDASVCTPFEPNPLTNQSPRTRFVNANTIDRTHMIIDRPNRLVYACISPRTSPELFARYCKLMKYEPIGFRAVDGNEQEIYHTNVMMALGESFVVICMEAVQDARVETMLRRRFYETDKDIIEISLDQMMAFAGNMLQVRNAAGDTYLVMSETAFLSLNKDQIDHIREHTTLLYSPIPTIEKYGGGSARCMMAEVFLEEKS